jgi:hypothetical protein
MDSVIDLKTGYINWDEIKKLTKDPDLDNATKQFKCKKCNISFYSKNYQGEFPLCIDHQNNTFKKK